MLNTSNSFGRSGVLLWLLLMKKSNCLLRKFCIQKNIHLTSTGNSVDNNVRSHSLGRHSAGLVRVAICPLVLKGDIGIAQTSERWGIVIAWRNNAENNGTEEMRMNVNCTSRAQVLPETSVHLSPNHSIRATELTSQVDYLWYPEKEKNKYILSWQV